MQAYVAVPIDSVFYEVTMRYYCRFGQHSRNFSSTASWNFTCFKLMLKRLHELLRYTFQWPRNLFSFLEIMAFCKMNITFLFCKLLSLIQ